MEVFVSSIYLSARLLSLALDACSVSVWLSMTRGSNTLRLKRMFGLLALCLLARLEINRIDHFSCRIHFLID